MRDTTDEQLMLDYQEGDTAAMDEFLRRYKNPVYRFVFRLSKNASEAEEITQEVFVRLHQFRHSWEPRGKFSTWLFGIAHNLCVSRFRKARWVLPWPVRPLEDEPVDFASPDPSPMDIAESVEATEAVKKCIQQLPFLQKEALVLREYEGLDYEEIAQILDKPLGTVKTLIHRARMNLKDMLIPFIEESTGGTDVQTPRS